jgi:apolipoprotein N-acyltransferase
MAWLESTLALLIGLALAQTFGRPQLGSASLLALACLATLLWRTPLSARAARARRGARLGMAFGLGWFGGGIWWLYISMAVYGGMAPPLAGAALLLFCAYLALYPALACALAAAIAPAARRQAWPLRAGLGAALALAAALTLGDFLRGEVFTGFPWLALGYAQVGSALAGYAPVLGVYGVGFAAALTAALLALLTQLSLRSAALAVLLPALLGVAGDRLGAQHWTWPSGPRFSVALLQGDIAQSEKFRPEKLAPTVALYSGMLGHLRADLLVTPETALPVLPEDLPPGYLEALDAELRAHQAEALLGIPLTRGSDQYTNSVVGLGGAAPYRYDKAHLVPFGEFVPDGFHWFIDLMRMPLGDFARGSLRQPGFVVQGARVAPTVCYEDLFGEELAQRFIDPQQAPNVIANLTNLAWFGNSVALPQHLEIARMRSLEFQLPSIRATNTGATAIIAADGTVQAELAPATVGVLGGSVQPRQGVTPYAWLAARLGAAPLLLLCLLGLGAAAALTRRRAP